MHACESDHGVTPPAAYRSARTGRGMRWQRARRWVSSCWARGTRRLGCRTCGWTTACGVPIASAGTVCMVVRRRLLCVSGCVWTQSVQPPGATAEHRRFDCTSECANDLFRQCRHYMLGGLQPQERRTSDGPAAAPASTLFGPEAVIGFDPTQASGSTWTSGMCMKHVTTWMSAGALNNAHLP